MATYDLTVLFKPEVTEIQQEAALLFLQDRLSPDVQLVRHDGVVKLVAMLTEEQKRVFEHILKNEWHGAKMLSEF